MTNMITYLKAESVKAYERSRAAIKRNDREVALLSYGIGNAFRRVMIEMIGTSAESIDNLKNTTEKELWP